ncbi:hypothetical protein NIES4072_31020 [Nostoc commune NIES-4072]|uniref:Uncharacterized protein n=1 Tax=Nostoc commune NIES-4072 TaxID=2005467 RepID=A0A2R5FUS5_NOSCO|nr:hypothetical protein [Nostoc commune]BBD69564.1 hypothetical protein NIES4070_59730 [Nostoc commune HK-02]GBG19434.1 hypothetical protein NIES4072_31020 [Nostoc commune NIES-4072]
MKYTLFPAITTVAFSVSSLLPVCAASVFIPPDNGHPDSQNGTGTRVYQTDGCDGEPTTGGRGKGRRFCPSISLLPITPSILETDSCDAPGSRGKGRRECPSVRFKELHCHSLKINATVEADTVIVIDIRG